MARMNLFVGFAHHTGIRLAEVGFLLILFAGVWLVAAQIPQLKLSRARTIVAGVALAIGGLLLIIATHWGQFG
jgi:nitrate reductase gamma subunit